MYYCNSYPYRKGYNQMQPSRSLKDCENNFVHIVLLNGTDFLAYVNFVDIDSVYLDIWKGDIQNWNDDQMVPLNRIASYHCFNY